MKPWIGMKSELQNVPASHENHFFFLNALCNVIRSTSCSRVLFPKTNICSEILNFCQVRLFFASPDVGKQHHIPEEGFLWLHAVNAG